ncbi:hypothetical protein [Lacinutrix sp. MEBiC02404]
MKNLKNLGKALTKAEQQTINGGRTYCVIGSTHCTCPQGQTCISANGHSGYCSPTLIMD